jgi:hypothetical protein
MTVRTHHRLLAAGFCLLLAGTTSAGGDALLKQPSPHFFPGRMLRSKSLDLAESAAPANDPPTLTAQSNHEPAPSTSDPGPRASDLEPFNEPPTLETRATPHLFFGQVRLQTPIRRPRATSQPPLEDAQPAIAASAESSKPTVSLAADTESSPAALHAPAQRIPAAQPITPAQPITSAQPSPSAPRAQLQAAEVRPAANPNLSAPHKILASLPNRQSAEKPASFANLKSAAVQPLAPRDEQLARQAGPAAPLQPAEVFSVPRPDFFAEEIQVTGLQTRLPQPGTSSPSPPLQPAAITPAVSSEPKYRLASLQQPLPLPAAPLQPAEVLPIPSPYSPAAPRIPELDQDRPIAALGTNIAPSSGKLPTDVAADRFQGDYPPWATRGYSEVAYFWDAPALCYGPLRFEEVNLERYGYGCCHTLQPFVSAAHFTGSLFALPYNMVNRPCWECIAPLGHYRPGSPVPYRKIWPEWNPLAASAECATIAGLILLIP